VKRILSLTLAIIFVLTISFSGGINTAYGNVGITSISASPNTVGVVADYQINIVPHSDVNIGGTISVQFPSAYNLPQSISVNNVDIAASHPSYISISSNTITMVLSQAVITNQPVLIHFSTQCGIVNPASPSTYNLSIWTSSEPNHVTGSFFIGIGGSGTLVTGLSVLINPSNAGKNSEYQVSFYVSTSGALVASQNDYVDVYFPAGTVVPTNPDASKVLMKTFPCTNVSVNGQRVRVYVPASLGFIAPGAQCNLDFTAGFGILNPALPGNYAIQVTTSKDTGLATSNMYYVFGTSISNLYVSVTPTNQLATAEYRVVFNTSTTGSLTANTDKINVMFPDHVTLPSNVVPGAITVDGTPCINVSVSGQTLSIVTPVSISISTQVTVDITQNFGIVNPDSTGSFDISVSTSNDASPVGTTFSISQSQVTQPAVQLTTTSSGQTAGYTVSFVTGASGALSGGVDKINIIFPVGTTMPSSISTSAITINNIPTTYITINGTTVTITIPMSIDANSSVTVIISESAGIKNPVTGGSFTLYVNTSKEPSSVQSAPYIIVVTPITTISVSPATPDGLNGFYRTKPTVTFTTTSSIDTNPTIYYYFDTNQPGIFGGQPIVVPEGIHTLYYYAVDNQQHQEQTKSMQFKVDTIPPQLTILTPQNNAVLNSKTVTVSGVVDPGSTIKIDGQNVTVDANGNFSQDITISGDSAVINIVATDPAGNTAQDVLQVSVDTTPPILTVTTPVAFQEIHKLPVTVEGQTEAGATVTVNGNSVEVGSDGTFSYDLATLGEGEISVIQVVAKDAAGNTTAKQISVKYIKQTVLKLQVNNSSALINTETVSLTSPPIIRDNRTLVPLRFISEAFGAKLTWDPIFQIIDITLGNDTIRLQIGKNFASVNGTRVALDTAPIIVKGSTLVPIRFISETLGSDVLWDSETKTVTIIYPKQ
jgi:hypothetical protein